MLPGDYGGLVWSTQAPIPETISGITKAWWMGQLALPICLLTTAKNPAQQLLIPHTAPPSLGTPGPLAALHPSLETPKPFTASFPNWRTPDLLTNHPQQPLPTPGI